ncbi:MAG: hypothetical protein DMG65_13025 [Candidatus Angelobacter sp. Gp1-AA117]|nr:MAG: hypothetical protein DMG65_13025 [Candidatus Angelobacter sp. Gp1-AA117]
MIMANNHGAMIIAIMAAMAHVHMMFAMRMAADLLRLSRRHIAIAPADLLAMFIVMDTNIVPAVMVALVIMANMHPMIAVMISVSIMLFIVMIFGEQRPAQRNRKNQQKCQMQSAHIHLKRVIKTKEL